MGATASAPRRKPPSHCRSHNSRSYSDNNWEVVPVDRPPRSAYLAWISVCLVWGTTYLAIRVALETFPPALLGGIRFTVAGIVLALVLAARGVPLPTVAAWPPLAVMGVLMISVGNGFVVWGEQWVPSGIAAVIVAALPFSTAAIEAFLPDGERVNARTLCGMLIGFAGILVLVWPDLAASTTGSMFALAAGGILLAEFGWALGSSYAKRQPKESNPFVASAMQMLFGGLVLVLVGTVRGEWSLLSFTTRTIVAEVYLIIFGSFAGYAAYIYALKYLPLSTVSLYAYINPIIAVVLAGVAVVRQRPKR
jgi:drug/metabolite transporter (DMT)-like permease